MAKSSKITTTLSNPDEKKKVVKYTGNDDAVLTSAYVGKKGLEKLGNPESIKITIEAADE